MSKYDNFEFISAEILVAEVKQQLKSYFDSGSITEIMIPTYISTALRKLNHTVLECKEDIIILEDYKAKLPADFAYLDDIYLCEKVDIITTPLTTTVFNYYKKTYCHDSCENEYETFSQRTVDIPSWITTHLKPCLLKVYYGSRSYCLDSCTGIRMIDNLNEVKINKKTVTANFQTGTLYVKYYTTPEDEYGPLIPNIVEVEDCIKAYLTFQLFDQLYNSVTDESINVIERKRALYKQEYYMKYEAALNMLKSQTKQQIRDGINKDRSRFIKFIING